MKKVEMKPFKELLLELRRRLRGDVAGMANTALSQSGDAMNSEPSTIPSHIADLGSETFEQDNTLRLLDNDGEVLGEIEALLKGLKRGFMVLASSASTRSPRPV